MMGVEELERRIEAARERGDGPEVARLRFELPIHKRERMRTYDSPEPPQLISRSEHRRALARTETGFLCSGQDTRRSLVLIGRRVFERLKGMRSADGREDSVWLTGRYQDSSRVLEVERAMWSAHEHNRAANSVRINYAEADHINAGLYPRSRVIGLAHTHFSDVEPSAADVEVWRGARDYLSGLPFLGLIVQERSTRGGMPVSAFVVDRFGCQPAEIKWRGI